MIPSLSLRALLAVTLLTSAACTSGPEPAMDTPDLQTSGEPDMRAVPDAAADLPASMPDASGEMTPDSDGEACAETPLYSDEDADGQGAGAPVQTACLRPGEQPQGALVREAGDCDDADPLQYTGSAGVCGDRVDDDCDEADEPCPTSMPAAITPPAWDCVTGAPPNNVYAWARFEHGKPRITPGCFVFFALPKGLFYVQRVGLDDTPDCTGDGCICKSDGGNGYDQRAYAFTLRGEAAECEPITLGDGENLVSNGCRKYLYHMYNDQRGYSFVSNDVEALEERLTRFAQVEVACVKDVTFAGFPYQSLLQAPITRNPDFVQP